jgi:hypothetical protein
MNNIKEFENVTVNMPSVIALGYGPISASRLSELVVSGKVIVTRKDNELFYTRATLNK